MKHIATILILLGLFLSGQTQCFFHKVYDNQQYNEGFHAVIESEDGSYVSCGSTSQDASLFIVKTTACGDTLWNRVYDFSLSGDGGYSIIETYDRNYAICGAYRSLIDIASDGYLFMIDPNGDSLSLSRYDAGYNDRCQEVLQTPDSGFVMAGFRNIYEDSSLFMIKTDKYGTQEWIEYYGGTGWDKPFDLQLTPDGGYVMSGERGNLATNSVDIFLLKADSLGNEEWYQYYNSQTNAYDGYGHVILTHDNGYLVSGTREQTAGGSDFEAWLIKTDSVGNVIWDKGWDLPYDGAHYLFDMDTTLDGNYFATAGGSNSVGPVTGPKPALIKFNGNGDTLWTRTYSFLGGVHHTYTNDMHTTKDGGAILSGYVINLSVSGDNQAWLLKVDSLGNVCTVSDTVLGCSSLDCNYITAEFTLTDTLKITDDSVIYQLQGSELATTWNWDLGNGNSVLQSPVAVYSDSGTYSIELAVAFDTLCFDTVVHNVVVVWDTLFCDTISANFNLNDTLWVADSNTITLQGPDNADSWNWDFGSLGTSIDQNPTITFSSGSYVISLVVEVDTLCWDSVAQSIVVIDTVTGLASLESQVSGFKLYPNPNDGNMTLDYFIAEGKTAEFRLYDIMGRTHKVVQLETGQNIYRINDSSLHQGLYLYDVRVDGEVVKTDKLVILK